MTQHTRMQQLTELHTDTIVYFSKLNEPMALLYWSSDIPIIVFTVGNVYSSCEYKYIHRVQDKRVCTVTLRFPTPHTVYPKNCAHGFCCALLCCGYAIVHNEFT